MTRTYMKADRALAEAHARLGCEAFGGHVDDYLKELDDDLISRVRVVEVGGEVAAGLLYFDAGQWFGGKRVRSWAIACVVTSPQFRAEGAGRALMLGMLREARQGGVPLSVLYASTPAFYRKCGFEPAGGSYAWKVDSDDLPRADTGARISRFEPDDRAVRDCYAAYASACNGVLDRTHWLWRQKLNPERGKRYRYRFDFEGRIEGYVSISGDRSGGLGVEDYAATSLRARRAILTFLHDHRSVNGAVKWYGGLHDPLRRLIPGNQARPQPNTEEWMLRLTDVGAALQQRGYPRADAELDLEVVDDAMPENAGRYRLTLRNGAAEVERGGDGHVRLDVRGLAALYTSHMSAEELVAAGLADGTADGLADATRVFAGPAPFMTDRF